MKLTLTFLVLFLPFLASCANDSAKTFPTDPLKDIISLLEKEEGFSKIPYKDSRGFWTIGFGHRCSENDDSITKVQAEEILRNDILKAEKRVSDLTDNEKCKAILVCMSFQLGSSGLRKFHTMLRYIRNKDFQNASKAMLQSAWYQQTPNRAKRMAKMMADLDA